MNESIHEPQKIGDDSVSNLARWLLLAVMVYGILVAVSVIGAGFKLATADRAKALFEFAANPALGLIIGMVATALIQSSSTVSSIIVALVAGGLPIQIAVPMIMGANIGTSITSTIVSLGHLADKREFQRAFSAATIHDFFNIMCVFMFLPLEIAFGFLEKASAAMVAFLASGSTFALDGFNPIKALTSPVNVALKHLFAFMPNIYAGVTMALIGIALIILAISVMGKTMKSLMVGRAKEVLHKSIGKGPLQGIFSGTVVTILVQSSSTTTSLVVPLVGNGVLTSRDIYPFTLGSNIGTCITALLAALAITGPNAAVALQIALVHMLYNTLGVTTVYGVKFLRDIPVNLSLKLAAKAAEQKLYGVGYIVVMFFALPLTVIALAG